MNKAFAENDRELETCRGQISEPTEKDFKSISLFSVSRGLKVVSRTALANKKSIKIVG